MEKLLLSDQSEFRAFRKIRRPFDTAMVSFVLEKLVINGSYTKGELKEAA